MFEVRVVITFAAREQLESDRCACLWKVIKLFTHALRAFPYLM